MKSTFGGRKMMLPKDKAQIALVFSGIISGVLGLGRMLSDSDHVRPEMMTYGTKGAFIAAIPKEAGPWLIIGGIAAFGLCFLIRRN
jgi:hypothetical protein